VNLHFLRHATFVLQFNGLNILVDPMLSHAGTMDPVGDAANTQRIPMLELPLDGAALTALLGQLDGVIVTHTHRDHWDARAVELLPKDLPLFCQPADVETFKSAGFTAVQPVNMEHSWKGITLIRTGGQHGTGDIGKRMGPVSGFVLQAEGEPSIFIAGDTVWCVEVASALNDYKPHVTVLNAGAAQFLGGDPITMTADDVIHVCRALPDTHVVAVHMETINHCLLTRAQLRQLLDQAGLIGRVMIPREGAQISKV
jgi:L-ascorbate metabolism protein UlaG (beta-lactamase superfamily)